jgi:hypothetical protein
MPSASLNSSRKTLIWIILLAALALLSILAMRRSLGKAMMMRAETTVDASPAQLRVGDKAKFVLKIKTATPAVSIEGETLEKQTETVYRRTGNTIKIAYDAATLVVMGKASDVREGAVVHVTVKVSNDRVLHAEQIVVLTGYVQVQ